MIGLTVKNIIIKKQLKKKFKVPGDLFCTIGLSQCGLAGLLMCPQEQETLTPDRTGNVTIVGYQFGTKFKLVFFAKYDRELDLGFWEILKPLKWTNIASFFLTNHQMVEKIH